VYIVTKLRSERTSFDFSNCAREHPFVHSVLSVCHAMSRLQYQPVALSARIYPTEVQINGRSASSARQRMCGSIPQLHSNQLRYLLYRSTETIWPAPVPGRNSRRLSVRPTVISPLGPRGNFVCLKIYRSAKRKYCITVYLCFVNYQNNQKIFPYTAIALLLLSMRRVFTTRYGLSLYTSKCTLTSKEMVP